MINRTHSINEYKKTNYKRFLLELPKEKFEQIKSHAKERSESVSGFIKRAIDEQIKRDSE